MNGWIEKAIDKWVEKLIEAIKRSTLLICAVILSTNIMSYDDGALKTTVKERYHLMDRIWTDLYRNI